MSDTEAAPNRERLYFPELDGLRFIAFLLVFLFHQGIPSATVSAWFGKTVSRSLRENGWVGVQIFFILSGYLITTLLLREEKAFGRIDLKAFWARRILRIWPLYYVTVAIVFLVIPALEGNLTSSGTYENVGRHLAAFLTFAGNWSMAVRGPVATDAQSILWSVCVEEQFYLVVPLIVAWVRPRFRTPLVLLMMALSIGLRGVLSERNVNQLMIQFNTFAQFDTLLGGVLLALTLGTDPRSGRVGGWLCWSQCPIYGATLWLLSRSNLAHGEAWHRTWDFVAIWAAGVAIVTIAVTVPGWLQRALSTPKLVWLGKISYGLYMFHEVAFLIKDRFSRLMGWFPFQDEILPLVSLAVTIGLAWWSYDRFESRFLRLKRRWTRVESRPE